MDPTVTTLQSVFRLAAPEALLVLAACIVFVGGAFRPSKAFWGLVALAAFIVPLVAVITIPSDLSLLRPKVSVLWPDDLASYTRIVAMLGGVVLLLMSWDELPEEHASEYFACLLILTAGTALVGAADELITLFLALEMISIPTYIMLYLPRLGSPIQEATVKYFLLSIFSSALLLFGFSYLYGVTGTTNIAAIHEALARTDSPALPALLLAAFVMAIAGLGFRITAVPFHFYAPDVYEGSAFGPAALLSFIPKVAGFVALIRLLGFVGPGPVLHSVDLGSRLPLLLWILAVLTMTVGNVVAIWQTDIKRLLAYSGIAHSGYMLMGLATVPFLGENQSGGVSAILFYMIAYGAMTIGAFAILQAVSTPQRSVSKTDDLVGLAGTHPILALSFALMLFSLIGLPLTAGFTGKLLIFMGALNAQGQTQDRLFLWLAIFGAINAAIGAYYYLRIVGVMYLRTAIHPLPGRISVYNAVALACCVAGTIWLGCYPAQVHDFARKSAKPVYALEPRSVER